MEKVFAGPGNRAGAGAGDQRPEKFNVAQLIGDAEAKDRDAQRFKDYDSDSHRSQSFPHTARKPLLSSMKRKDSKESSTTSQSFDTTSPASTVTGTPVTSPQKSLSIREESNEEAMLSERAGHTEPHSDSSDTEERRVQFNRAKFQLGSAGENIIEEMEIADDGTDEKEKKKHKGRHQHYKRRKSSMSDHHHHHHRRPTNEFSPDGRISVQPEDVLLKESHMDDLISHRSDDPRALRRHRIQPSEKLQRTQPLISPKKQFDHSPHEIFVQLDELQGMDEWKETARWIKYEEDVEEGADRWGRPHVAPLSFHSLLNLRLFLEQGVVLLDLEERDFPGVAYKVIEMMDSKELIHHDDKPKLLRALLLRHRHVNENASGFPFGARRKFSSYTSLQHLWDDEIRNKANGGLNTYGSTIFNHIHNNNIHGINGLGDGACINNNHNNHMNQCNGSDKLPPDLFAISFSERMRRHSTMSHKINLSSDSKPKIVPACDINGHAGSHSTGDARIDLREETYSSSQEDLKRLQNDSILKRIPSGAEATTVLVGSVDFLGQPTGAFVRLAEAIHIPGITEIPIPVRFIFILMGPKLIDIDYHEVGRSIATLMSNDSFHKIAYKADDRQELLSAINEFLDDSIVLPPGNWTNENLLPFEELKAKSEWIRSRKAKALQLRKKEKSTTTSDDEKKLLAAQEESSDVTSGRARKKRNPLERTNRPWGGLINDIKRRYPMFKSDIVDGLNSETLAATIFMYFAALSTAITFGGLCSEKTKNLIGIPETLLAASVVGMVFHLLSGQPLTIIGTTGPLVLFDEALYKFCLNNDIPFLTVRLYISLWMGIIALVVSAFEGSVNVRLFTRFTQEIFSALITLIYIVEAIMKIFISYQRHPLLKEYIYADWFQVNKTGSDINSTIVDTNFTTNAISIMQNVTATIALPSDVVFLASKDKDIQINQPNTALFCTFLTLGTFTLAYFLRIFRNSHFLGRTARRALGDFGVPIAIAVFVLIDYFVPSVFTEKLRVPEGLEPSDTSKRGWLIPITPDNIPVWLPFAAGIPAILVYILVFMETHISELIVDKPERGLKKGSGLHLDIVLLSFLNMVCGFFGMPWHCAATVRSVTHVSAVTIMSRTHAPGDKPHITDVKEQRLSGLCVSMMVGLSVTAAPLLRLIPMSVLFGVFLYMGVASMTGVQFFERLSLLFMPVKYHPSEAYVRRVHAWKMHVYTLVQVFALVLLWVVKSSQFSLAFPFFLIMMVPLRQRLSMFFNSREINALDGKNPSVDPSDEPDFYEQAIFPA
ncbi:anion exchange protein 3 isoform X2 [Sitodiplosis mosellana]|nr:anion exchange protein 3 isoform X2 [Sitodiplosis mosellana]